MEIDNNTYSNNIHDQYDFFCYGMGLMDYGLAVQSAHNGFGMLTMGLVWQGHDIWGPYQGASLSTTGWTLSPGSYGISTVWTNSVFGEYPNVLV